MDEKWLDKAYYDEHAEEGYSLPTVAEVFRCHTIPNGVLRKALPGFPQGFRFTLGERNVRIISGGLDKGEGCVYTCSPVLYYGSAARYDNSLYIYPRDEYGRIVDTRDAAAWLRGLMWTMYCRAHHALQGDTGADMLNLVCSGMYYTAVQSAFRKEKAARERADSCQLSAHEEWCLLAETKRRFSPKMFELQALVVLQRFIDWYDKWEADGSPVDIEAMRRRGNHGTR